MGTPDREANYGEEPKRKHGMESDAASNLLKPSIKKRKTELECPLSDFLTKTIAVNKLPMTSHEYANEDPTDAKYEIYLDMSHNEEKMTIPSPDDIERADMLKKEYAQLKAMEEEPEDYFEQATRLKALIENLEPRLKKEILELGTAVNCYHVAQEMRKYCKESDDLDTMVLWKDVEDALTSIGVSDFIKFERDRRQKIQIEMTAREFGGIEWKGSASRRKKPLKRDKTTLCMTAEKFSTWLTLPWSNKNTNTGAERSGPNRLNHGIQLHKTASGESILICCLCKGGMPLPKKFGQHFATDGHWQEHLKLVNSTVSVKP